MKLVLQIAGGIILAVIIISFVRYWPDILADQREHAAFLKVSELTPDVLIRRCGNPVKDTKWNMAPDAPSSIVYRYLYYGRDSQPRVLVKFSQLLPEDKSGDIWHLYTIAPVSDLNDTFGAFQWDTDRAKVLALPCLAN